MPDVISPILSDKAVNIAAPWQSVRMQNNNRKYVRRRAADYYLITDLDSGLIIGRILNLSPNGMLVAGDAPLVVGQAYRLRIKLPEKILGDDCLFLEAACRRDKFNKRSDWWEHGLEITECPPQARQIIQQIVLNLVDNADGSLPKPNPADSKLEYIRMSKYRRG